MHVQVINSVAVRGNVVILCGFFFVLCIVMNNNLDVRQTALIEE